MSDVIDNSSKEYLKQFMARIERLEEDKNTVLEDIKETYAEAKGQGFDVKVLRQIDVSTLFRTTCYADFCIFSYSSYSTGDK